MAPDALSFPELADARARVADALSEASAAPDAARRLKVGPAVEHELVDNLNQRTLPALPGSRLFTGVLFDALDFASLTPGQKRRAHASVLVVTALHGALRLGDAVAPFRVSMGVDLPGIGGLAAFWRPLLAEALAPVVAGQLVVDCRSTDYRAAWRATADQAEHWVQVDVPGASHGAKHTRGLVARRLLQAGPVRRPEALPDALGAGFRVDLAAPGRPAQPWRALVTRVADPDAVGA